MRNLDKISVFLSIEELEIQLGTLALSGNKIYFKISEEYFEYFDAFPKNKLRLSPYKIEHSNQVQNNEDLVFDGLFGLFADTLPDAWGTLILDRYLSSLKFNEVINPLTRLAFVGDYGMGALKFYPEFNVEKNHEIKIDLSYFKAESEKILIGENSKIINEFYSLSGTSGGARPKINIGFNPSTEELIPHSEILPNGFEHWLVKFPSRFDVDEIAKVEYTYYQLAKLSGINISDSILLKGENNELFYATKRFDRINNQRLHIHSLAGLLHDDFTKNSLDYGHLIDVALTLTNNRKTALEIIKLLTFNIIFCNQDDHSKNFSFLMDKSGTWSFAPAYDLTYSPSPYNYHSLSVAKTFQNISLEDVQKLGKHFSIEETDKAIAEVIEVSTKWKEIAKDLDIKKEMINRIENEINKRRVH